MEIVQFRLAQSVSIFESATKARALTSVKVSDISWKGWEFTTTANGLLITPDSKYSTTLVPWHQVLVVHYAGVPESRPEAPASLKAKK